MITLTRLNGATFALNDTMVERVEANPDTVVVLTDGKKFIVAEAVDEVVEQIRRARADVAMRSSMIEVVDEPGPDLRLVKGREADPESPGDDDGVERIDDGADIEMIDGDNANNFTAKEGGSWIQ